MGRTATFKANEGYRGPTGIVPISVEETVTGEESEEVADADGESEESEESEEAVSDDEVTSEEVAEEIEKDYPEGTPTSAWRVGEIDAWASDQDPAVELLEGSTKNEKLDQIKKSSEEKS